MLTGCVETIELLNGCDTISDEKILVAITFGEPILDNLTV